MIALTITAAILLTTAPLAAQPLRAAPGASWRLSWETVWTWARLGLGIAGKTPDKSRDAGCGIDPNGGFCGAGINTAPDGGSDGGWGIDPNG